MADVDEATKRARARRMAALKPLFDTADEVGIYRAELARRLGMPRMRLWRYEHGWDRVPPDFISRACQALRVPQSIVRLDGPVDLYIQQPRTKKTPQESAKSTKTKPASQAKGRRNHDSLINDGNDSQQRHRSRSARNGNARRA